MKPSRLLAGFGVLLLIGGLLFDFGFVTTTDNFRRLFATQTPHELWKTYSYELVRSYFFALGLASIALGLLGATMAIPRRSQWTILGLAVVGSLLLLAGGLWEAQIGPVYEMEPACYVLGSGLLAILAALVLEAFALLARS